MVFGTGCMLDESRFVNVVADYVGLNADVISAQVIGEHGDSQVPLWSKTTIAGIHIKEYCSALNLDFNSEIRINMERMVLDMGSTIIRGKQRTHYGISTCVCYIADAILNRRATISCVTSVLDNEYGISDVALSLPSIINFKGVAKRMEEQISQFELERLRNSADVVRAVLSNV
jgi:L-lactate dehydrogenase